ncbi:MAG: helix-turn-helix domain-containing protein [Planctomycetota bacterium]
MLKPNTNKYPPMTAAERGQFEQAVAEEQGAKAANIEAAKQVLPRLTADCEQASDFVRQLREAREAAGVSLAEMEQRTGIRKSVLSRLENSKAPNPTLATVQRYCEALDKRVVFSIENDLARN